MLVTFSPIFVRAQDFVAPLNVEIFAVLTFQNS